MSQQALTPEMPFSTAFEVWISRRIIAPAAGTLAMPTKGIARYLKPRSIHDLRDCAVALGHFFGQLSLGQIHCGHLAEYQRARALCDTSVCHGGHWAKPCGANRIRKEIEVLIRVLKAARLWGDEQKFDLVKVAREDKDVPRSMDSEEQDRFFRTAASREEWHFIQWYACLGIQTAAATNELRSLRIGDIALGCPGQELIHIRSEGAKNKYRIRTVPLEGMGVWGMQKLVERATSLGAKSPHHYLFPFRAAPGRWDPTRPMSDTGMKKPWDAVRTEAGLKWLRMYDLRHTGITRMAEAGVPIDVCMSLVGHMTMEMHNRYTSIQTGSKRKWMNAAWGDPQPATPGLGRKPVVKENQIGTSFAQRNRRPA